jgi:hypothetical protein
MPQIGLSTVWESGPAAGNPAPSDALICIKDASLRLSTLMQLQWNSSAETELRDACRQTTLRTSDGFDVPRDP